MHFTPTVSHRPVKLTYISVQIHGRATMFGEICAYWSTKHVIHRGTVHKN